MGLTAWVDVAVGLALVYLGASLFVTIINEYLAQALNLRGRHLWASLRQLVDDPAVRERLARIPALRAFFGERQRDAGSYVDPNELAAFLVGSLAANSGGESMRAALAALAPSALRVQLECLAATAGDGAAALVTPVSHWVDRSLTMMGEGYKRRLQLLSLAVGAAVAVGLNLDSVALTGRLYGDKEARDAAAAVAVKLAEGGGRQEIEACMKLPPAERAGDPTCASLAGLVGAVQSRNTTLGKLPIGWPLTPFAPGARCSGWIGRIVGWALTALALSLGGPFWFDILGKLVNMRHGMRPPRVQGTGGA